MPGDVPPLGAQSPADADFPGPLRHGRQHDIHDADAADDQRHGSDSPQHQGKNALGLLGFFQQVQRHRDFRVLFLVELIDQPLDDLRGLLHVLHLIDRHGDLADLQPLHFESSGVVIEQQLAETDSVGLKRNIDVAVIILGGLAAAHAGRGRSPLGDPDHVVIMVVVHADGSADRIFDRK